jgi:hypothetical protein
MSGKRRRIVSAVIVGATVSVVTVVTVLDMFALFTVGSRG